MKISLYPAIAALCLLATLFFACAALAQGTGAPAATAAAAAAPKVKLTTSKGDILLELFPDKAPATVENFLKYVEAGHYNGLIFHRVIGSFMIQGGGMDKNMEPRQTREPIVSEADNGLSNGPYTVAMARTSDPNSATAQFFINVADNKRLDHSAKTLSGWGYCVFGKVIEGRQVVEAIKNVSTGSRAGHADVPLEPVEILKAVVVR